MPLFFFYKKTKQFCLQNWCHGKMFRASQNMMVKYVEKIWMIKL